MTDKELIELAAKAAELPECGWMGPSFVYVKDNTFVDWNPLEDDGDALRLAVKCGLLVDVRYAQSERVSFNSVTCWPTPSLGAVTHFDDMDVMAATRRAIVRAAAQLA